MLTRMNIDLTASPIHTMQPQDVHQLYKLRVDVFVHEQQCPYQEIDDTDAAPDTRHILAFANDEQHLVGTARMFPSTVDVEGHDVEVAQFGRFAVAADARGTGVARRIMEYALQLAEQILPGAPVFLEAQAPLVDYYAGYGFAVCGPEFLDEGVPHVPMIRR